MKRYYHYSNSIFVLMLFLLGWDIAVAAPIVSIRVVPEQTTINLETDRQPRTLVARVNLEGMTYTWKLDGPGRLDGDLSSRKITYLPPENLAESATVTISLTATEERAGSATAQMTLNLITSKKSAPKQTVMIEPDVTPTIKPTIKPAATMPFNPVQLQRQREEKIAPLLSKADEYFRRQQFIEPKGENAFALYKEVLRLDQYHQLSREKMFEMVKAYKKQGDAAYQQQDWNNSCEQYQRADMIADYLHTLGERRIENAYQEIQTRIKEINCAGSELHIELPPIFAQIQDVSADIKVENCSVFQRTQKKNIYTSACQYTPASVMSIKGFAALDSKPDIPIVLERQHEHVYFSKIPPEKMKVIFPVQLSDLDRKIPYNLKIQEELKSVPHNAKIFIPLSASFPFELNFQIGKEMRPFTNNQCDFSHSFTLDSIGTSTILTPPCGLTFISTADDDIPLPEEVKQCFTLKKVNNQWECLRRKEHDLTLTWAATEHIPSQTLAASVLTERKQQYTITFNKTQLVEIFLKKAQDSFNNGEMAGEKNKKSAFYFYSKVLRLDPTNRFAEEGIFNIVQHYKTLGDKASAQRKYENAQEQYETSLSIAEQSRRFIRSTQLEEIIRSVQTQLTPTLRLVLPEKFAEFKDIAADIQVPGCANFQRFSERPYIYEATCSSVPEQLVTITGFTNSDKRPELRPSAILRKDFNFYIFTIAPEDVKIVFDIRLLPDRYESFSYSVPLIEAFSTPTAIHDVQLFEEQSSASKQCDVRYQFTVSDVGQTVLLNSQCSVTRIGVADNIPLPEKVEPCIAQAPLNNEMVCIRNKSTDLTLRWADAEGIEPFTVSADELIQVRQQYIVTQIKHIKNIFDPAKADKRIAIVIENSQNFAEDGRGLMLKLALRNWLNNLRILKTPILLNVFVVQKSGERQNILSEEALEELSLEAIGTMIKNSLDFTQKDFRSSKNLATLEKIIKAKEFERILYVTDSEFLTEEQNETITDRLILWEALGTRVSVMTNSSCDKWFDYTRRNLLDCKQLPADPSHNNTYNILQELLSE